MIKKLALKIYHQKRNFNKTPEPEGKLKSGKNKFSYFIQKHAASHLHYDFRLELNGVLKSWAIPKGPSLDPAVKRLAVHVEDHPLEYGNFEGHIPKGQYGGGAVLLWDKGEWLPENSKIENDYQKGSLTFELKGKKLKGLWKLIRIKSDPKNWLLIKVADKYARDSKEYDVIHKKAKSILSNKTIEQLEDTNITLSEKMPYEINLQLATLSSVPPTGNEWIHEMKFDGYRLITFIENGKIRLITRGKQDWTAKFEKITSELQKLTLASAILDGEIVFLDENQRPNFQLLQNSINDHKRHANYVYYIFDIIYLNGKNLSSLSLIERKYKLNQIIKNDNACLRYSDHITGHGEEVFAKSCKLGIEGIVSKNVYSHYVQKRTYDWLKIKCTNRQEFVIGGFTLPKGQRKNFGSLLLGLYSSDKTFKYCGHVGTGFNTKSLDTIATELKKYQSTHMPFDKVPPASRHAIWTRPVLVAEVEFTEWTSDGYLRHPVFRGLRVDKHPKEIVMEKPDVKMTHPNKILYQEQAITKLQLYEYYESIQKYILPYVINRPLTLVCCPNGVKGKCFYQRHPGQSTPSQLKSVLIKEKSKKANYLYINSMEGLLILPQLNVLEIHTWGSQVQDLENPDIIVFDLDPGTGVKWQEVVEAANLIKTKLLQLKLKSFVKSTGGKGLHVVIPVKPQHNWEEIKNFSHAFVVSMEKTYPDKYISTMTKSKRHKKIFIDYLRNQRSATAIAPYSTRAGANATVATPLDWDELTDNIQDTTFTIKTMLSRIQNMKNDPWRKFFQIKQQLNLDKLINK